MEEPDSPIKEERATQAQSESRSQAEDDAPPAAADAIEKALLLQVSYHHLQYPPTIMMQPTYHLDPRFQSRLCLLPAL